jgi:hypothetical protein
MDMYGLRRYTGDKNRPKEMTFPAKKKKQKTKRYKKENISSWEIVFSLKKIKFAI